MGHLGSFQSFLIHNIIMKNLGHTSICMHVGKMKKYRKVPWSRIAGPKFMWLHNFDIASYSFIELGTTYNLHSHQHEWCGSSCFLTNAAVKVWDLYQISNLHFERRSIFLRVIYILFSLNYPYLFPVSIGMFGFVHLYTLVGKLVFCLQWELQIFPFVMPLSYIMWLCL